MAGLELERSTYIKAKVPQRINSEKGRTEFNLVHLVHNENGFSAYSTGKGSGSITGFARADGFMEIPRNTEMLEAGEITNIHLLGKTELEKKEKEQEELNKKVTKIHSDMNKKERLIEEEDSLSQRQKDAKIMELNRQIAEKTKEDNQRIRELAKEIKMLREGKN